MSFNARNRAYAQKLLVTVFTGNIALLTVQEQDGVIRYNRIWLARLLCQTITVPAWFINAEVI